MVRRARCFQEAFKAGDSVSEFGEFIICPGIMRRLNERTELFDFLSADTHALVPIPNIPDATRRPPRQLALQSMQHAFDRLVSVTIASDLSKQTCGLVQSRCTPHHFLVP